MNYETITYDVTDDIAVITMNRPEVLNAMTSQMRAELLNAIKDASSRARVLVVTGAGRAFCSGQDLADRGTGANLDLERTLRDEYQPMIEAIIEAPIPVIAAVNGTAAGAGANLALAADVVIAAESAIFLQAFTRIGLVPDAGGSWFLPRQIGLARAMGASLFAEPVSAQQALDWGMIWEVAADDAFEAKWRARAAQLAKGPTVAYRGVKQSLRASFSNEATAQLELEAKIQGQCGRSRDFREGVMAFIEKRPAKFEGR